MQSIPLSEPGLDTRCCPIPEFGTSVLAPHTWLPRQQIADGDVMGDGVSGQAVRLRMGRGGKSGAIVRVREPRRQPGDDEVEIAVRAASLNFVDVLSARGKYPSEHGQPPLGADCSGVVVRRGPAVTEPAIGDRVAALVADDQGAWSSHVTVPCDLVLPMPEELDFTTAAALPAVGLTAWYGIKTLARVESGESVLVHCATGGVGLIAVGLACAAGARVYGTAGSPAKRRYLRALGVEGVTDSRTVGFADSIRRATGGRGVDVVLNCLPGAAQQAGLETLAIGGRFVELGKRDIYSGGSLGLTPFRRNLAFFSVDLQLLAQQRPTILRNVARQVARSMAHEDFPLPPVTVWEGEQAREALEVMAGARHTGKMVLDFTRGKQPLAMSPAA
ncbi:zinc-binding dehydrogenase [Streptomyces sp. Ac-502]|uniref:zinc-binding dehydrogenase n=1 Tax=Streptomyces sp. Ac-502 TaxID=3342801 RepID=UPI003862608F